MIDLHCHLLPDVDDGARTLQQALRLVRLAVDDGIDTMVLTPHVYAGRWDNALPDLQPKFDAFARLVAGKYPALRLLLGAEAHLMPETLAAVQRGLVPFLGESGGRSVLLLELPDGRIPPFTTTAVRHLMAHGVRPMIAHPERNKDVMAEPAALGPLIDAGCLVQVTAGSLCGDFGTRAHAAALALLERDWIDVVATDAHHPLRRPPRMRAAHAVIAARCGTGRADRLTTDCAAGIIAARLREAAVRPAASQPSPAASQSSQSSQSSPAASPPSPAAPFRA